MKSGGTHPWCPLVHLVFANRNDVQFIWIQSREWSSDPKWSLEMHVEMPSNARCELTYLKQSTRERISQDAYESQVWTNSHIDLALSLALPTLPISHISHWHPSVWVARPSTSGTVARVSTHHLLIKHPARVAFIQTATLDKHEPWRG